MFSEESILELEECKLEKDPGIRSSAVSGQGKLVYNCTQMAPSWYPTDTPLVPNWYLTKTQLVPSWYLNKSQPVPNCVLIGF